MKPLIIRDLQLDDGSFKLCVTLTPETIEQLRRELQEIDAHKFSLIEWRADYLCMSDAIIEKIKIGIELIKDAFPAKPLLFTFRWNGEGGQTSLSPTEIASIRKGIIKQNKVEMIDFELCWFENVKEEKYQNEYCYLVEQAKKLDIKVIISWHDFEETPDEEKLLGILKAQENVGADIAKIATYAKNKRDLDSLISASARASEILEIPHVALSMGSLGESSRYDWKNSSSCITFAPVDKPSAPGQVALAELQLRLSKRLY